MQFLKDHAMHGIKIHPDMLGIPLDDPRMQHIYARCQEADIPVLLHTGDRRFDFTNPNRLEPMLRALSLIHISWPRQSCSCWGVADLRVVSCA